MELIILLCRVEVDFDRASKRKQRDKCKAALVCTTTHARHSFSDFLSAFAIYLVRDRDVIVSATASCKQRRLVFAKKCD